MSVNKPIRIETLRSSSQDVAEWIEKFEPQTVKWDNEHSASQGVSFFEDKELWEKAKKIVKCTDGKEKSVLAINETINSISNGKHQKVFENISKKATLSILWKVTLNDRLLPLEQISREQER
ncbi:unnamed protein product [Brachionus calyciflorus]|uniref:Uncharacterized protein n=1 Tax=Brachionus calyciflorus TaxID=104777 RepID=A0A813R9J9_9BILA|nr:unnamed protein product [Brachionus calyciflorus]